MFAFLVVAVVLGAMPGPAQAACAYKYTVQSGDTLYRIASNAQVKFDDLVAANKLKAPYLIYVGQVLCMPLGAVKPTDAPSVSTTPGASTSSTTKSGPTVTSMHMGQIAWLALTNFPKERILNIKVWVGNMYYTNGPEYVLGMVTTDKKGAFAAYFHMPPELHKVDKVTFCAKDVLNDDIIACDYGYYAEYYMLRRADP
jgi:murein DD-endopeptidase MepM/ murein hydrolase activator NlpD